MNYAKPEINVVASANSAIETQSSNKPHNLGSDSVTSPYQTIGAYEGDE
jgi:hypothetical protein